jgi:hypothetical protein
MAWTYVGVSTVASAASGNITLTEPSGVQEGDLLVCVISYRSNAAFSSPGAPWVSVTSQNSGNTTANGTGSIGSGHMFYCIRGASAPGLVFTRTAGDVALGRIVAYRGSNRNSSVLVTQTSTTLAAAATAVSVTGLTTQYPRDLIVVGFCGARNGSASAFRATNPGTSSGTASNETGNPAEGDWQERCDSGTTTGADTTLAIADALRATAGATGNLLCTASSSARHVVVAAAFMEEEDLTATGIATGAPSVGTPVITQVHAITATGIATGAPTVGTPLLEENSLSDDLTANGIATGAPTVGTPALTQVHTITATGVVTGAPTVGSPALTQEHDLTATGIAAGAPTVGSPAITQAHELTATGVDTGAPTVGTPILGILGLTYDLTADDLSTGAPTVGTPALTENAATQPAQAGGSWAFLDAFSPRRSDVSRDDTPKPKKAKRKRLKADTIELAPDGPVEVQTGIVKTTPAWDVLIELQRLNDEAEIARQQRLRAIALADDEWLMMAG